MRTGALLLCFAVSRPLQPDACWPDTVLDDLQRGRKIVPETVSMRMGDQSRAQLLAADPSFFSSGWNGRGPAKASMAYSPDLCAEWEDCAMCRLPGSCIPPTPPVCLGRPAAYHDSGIAVRQHNRGEAA